MLITYFEIFTIEPDEGNKIYISVSALYFSLKRAIRAVVHTFKTIRNVSITGHKDRKFSLLTLIQNCIRSDTETLYFSSTSVAKCTAKRVGQIEITMIRNYFYNMLVKDVLAYSYGPICTKCGKCYPQEKSQSMQWISIGETNCIIRWTEMDSTDD